MVGSAPTHNGLSLKEYAEKVANLKVKADRAKSELDEAKADLSAALCDAARRELGNKLYGSASFTIPGIGKFKAGIKRTVRWDQEKLRVIALGLDADSFPLFFSLELKPDETVYERLPDNDPIKIALTAARTTRYDEQPRVELVSLEDAA